MDLIMCAARPDNATVARALAAAVQPILADIVSNGWLLTAARDAAREQWPAETVWLVKGQAFLSRDGEYVNLNLVGRDKSLPVFVLDYTVGWRELAGLDAAYAEWSNGRQSCL